MYQVTNNNGQFADFCGRLADEYTAGFFVTLGAAKTIADDLAERHAEPFAVVNDAGRPVYIAKEASVNPEPWKAYQLRDDLKDGAWIDFPFDKLSSLAGVAARTPECIRRKPRAVTINGYHVPAPHREPLDIGTAYHVPAPATLGGIYCTTWTNSKADHRRLNAGLIHLDPDSAKRHAEALRSFTSDE